jgi:hypothetical protein
MFHNVTYQIEKKKESGDRTLPLLSKQQCGQNGCIGLHLITLIWDSVTLTIKISNAKFPYAAKFHATDTSATLKYGNC